MSSEIWAQVIAAVAGIGITVLFRLVDRYLPDPQDKHPLPATPLAKVKPKPAPAAAPATDVEAGESTASPTDSPEA